MAKSILVDERLDSYRSFFDHAWAARVLDLTNGSKLSQPAFDLCASWRGAANTHVLPFMLIHHLKAYSEGFVNARDPFGSKWITVVRDRLIQEMGDSLCDSTAHSLEKALNKLYDECKATQAAKPYEFDEQQAWESYFSNAEFHFSLWGSQRLCFASLYYSYEFFLLTSLRLARGESSYRIRPKVFSKDFASEFGVDLRDRCWSDSQINIARLTRHCLVHNGARLTKDLEKQHHGLDVVDGEIQVLAPDTIALYDLLKDRTLALAEHAVGLPQFSDIGEE